MMMCFTGMDDLEDELNHRYEEDFEEEVNFFFRRVAGSPFISFQGCIKFLTRGRIEGGENLEKKIKILKILNGGWGRISSCREP